MFYTITDKSQNKAKANVLLSLQGKTQGDNIEVLSGLENGNEIIDEGAVALKTDRK